jgi:hypothetical protein
MKLLKRVWFRVLLAIVAVPSICILAVLVWVWNADSCAEFKLERLNAIERRLFFSLPASATNIKANCFWGAHVQFDIDSNEICNFIQSSLISPEEFVSEINEEDSRCAIFLNDEAQSMDSYLHGVHCGSRDRGLQMEILIDTSNQTTYRVYARSYGAPIFGEQRMTRSTQCPF